MLIFGSKSIKYNMNSIKYNIDTAVSPYYNYLSTAQYGHFFKMKNIEIRFIYTVANKLVHNKPFESSRLLVTVKQKL